MRKVILLFFLLILGMLSYAQNDDYQTGLDYYEREDYESAFPYLLKAANRGIVDAQGFIAEMYDLGKGIAINQMEAIEWYKKAAAQGDALSQYNLGIKYSYV